jgi:hypothetical protein
MQTTTTTAKPIKLKDVTKMIDLADGIFVKKKL